MPTTRERLSSALTERYRIEREVGQGGMAKVYLARSGANLSSVNGSLMAFRVTTSPSFVSGVPRALFSAAGLVLGFDVGVDGRFLMLRGTALRGAARE